MQKENAKKALVRALTDMVSRSAPKGGAAGTPVDFANEPLWFSDTEESYTHYQSQKPGTYVGVILPSFISNFFWRKMGLSEDYRNSLFSCEITITQESDADNPLLETYPGSKFFTRTIKLTHKSVVVSNHSSFSDTALYGVGISYFRIIDWDLPTFNKDARIAHSVLSDVWWNSKAEIIANISNHVEYGAQAFSTVAMSDLITELPGYIRPEEVEIYQVPVSINMASDWSGDRACLTYTLPNAVIIRYISVDDGTETVTRIENESGQTIDVLSNSFDRMMLPEGKVADGFGKRDLSVVIRKLYLGDDNIDIQVHSLPSGEFKVTVNAESVVDPNNVTATKYCWLPYGAANANDYTISAAIKTDANNITDATLTETPVDVSAGSVYFGLSAYPTAADEIVYTVTITHKPSGTVTNMDVRLAFTVQA